MKSGNDRKYDVAVVGATGAVGEAILEILASRKFPAGRVHALASEASVGRSVTFGHRSLPVDDLATFDFEGCDFALFSAGSRVSEEAVPRAAGAGCVVIDNTSRFRMDPDVALVIPEINSAVLDGCKGGDIIANPNCSTIQMLMALWPLHAEVGIERVDVATYQSVSGAGRPALEELARQSADRFNFRDPQAKALSAPIAFNVIPQIDEIGENGYSGEEMKMHNETRKILDDDRVVVSATAVRVPVFYGHGEAIHVRLRQALELSRAAELIGEAAGVRLVERGSEGPVTPLTHAAGRDEVVVSRLRRDLGDERVLCMWVVADNVRKGAALNAVQIAERLVEGRAGK